MTLALIVWLVMTAIPAIKVMGIIGIGVSIILWVILAINYDCISAEYRAEEKAIARATWMRSCKNFRWAIPLLVIGFLLPNQKTAWYMVGAYAAEAAVTSEVAGELGGAAKDMMLELMKKAKQEIGEVDGEVVKDAAKAAIQEVSK